MTETALRIEEVIEKSTFGRTTVYKAIKLGELITRKRGRRTVVLETDYNNWIRGLPSNQSQAVAALGLELQTIVRQEIIK